MQVNSKMTTWTYFQASEASHGTDDTTTLNFKSQVNSMYLLKLAGVHFFYFLSNHSCVRITISSFQYLLMTQELCPEADSKPPEHEIAADSEAETETVRCLVEAPDLVELVQSPEAVAAGAGLEAAPVAGFEAAAAGAAPVAGLEAAAAGAAPGDDPEAAEVGAGLEAAAAAAGLEAGPGDDLEAGLEAAAAAAGLEVGAEADLEAGAEGAGLVEVDLVVPAEVFGGHLARGPDHLRHLVHLPGPSLANVCHVHPFEAILETKTKKRIFSSEVKRPRTRTLTTTQR